MEGKEAFPRKISPEQAWVPRPERALGEEHFSFQYEFAKEIQRLTGDPVLRVIRDYTSFLRMGLFDWDPDKKYVLKPGVTDDDLVTTAYQNATADLDPHPVPYHSGIRHGCFSYTFGHTTPAAYIHFSNAEFDSTGPLDHTKIERRKGEIADMLAALKAERPDIESMNGNSWLYNTEAYKRLFPPSYIETLRPDMQPIWRSGAVWGQFLTSDYSLKTAEAETFLARVRAIESSQSYIDINDALCEALSEPPLMQPLRANAPIQDFYDFYGVK